jgi:ElaB/YqjD/DUF883 family membrane-anchored ribosome-binding protein
MSDIDTQDPAAIEREIRETQNNMSSTIDKIGDQLSIKNMFNALLDKADENNIDARMVLDGARRNPVALGLIAAGTIWLISEKDAKLPSFSNLSGKQKGQSPSNSGSEQDDYLLHMSSVERYADEDDTAYQQRHDKARSSFFNVEREPDEEDGAFRKRLDAMSESFRQKRHDISHRSSQFRDSAKEKASTAVYKTKDLFSENPIVGGMVAAAVGAAFGASLPVTEQEKGKLGPIGDKLRQTVGAKTEEATTKFREKKDELLEKADTALQPAEPSDSIQDNNASDFSSGREGQLA